MLLLIYFFHMPQLTQLATGETVSQLTFMHLYAHFRIQPAEKDRNLVLRGENMGSYPFFLTLSITI